MDHRLTSALSVLITLILLGITYQLLLDLASEGDVKLEVRKVSEAEVRAAQRWAARKLRLVIEPGGSVALAALLAGKVEARPDLLVVLSGGNADPAAYARVLSGDD